MLPQSYDHVSEETKQTVQLFIARAGGYLQGKGHCDEEVEATMNKVKERANREALEMAVAAWKRSHQPCTAERFVQWFADLLWDAVTSEDDRLWPYHFKASVYEGPLSSEFLDAVGITEEHARGSPQVKKETMTESERSNHTLQIPGKPQSPERQPPTAKETPAKRETPDEKQETSKEQVISTKQEKPLKEAKTFFHLKPDLEEPTTLQAAILNRLDAEADYTAAKKAVMSKKRKNEEPEPEPVAPKRQRRDFGETFASGSFTGISKVLQWPGIPLADHEFMLMNAGLMEAIWESLIYQGDHIYHNAGVFAVKIPKDEAWLLLGKEIRKVFRLVERRWYPLRLHTCDLGRYFQVGLWVEKIHSRGQMVQEVRCKSEELYHVLRHWAFQVECGEMQSLASLLHAYLRELGMR